MTVFVISFDFWFVLVKYRQNGNEAEWENLSHGDIYGQRISRNSRFLANKKMTVR